MLHLQHEFVQPLSVVHAKPSFAFCMHWNHELASSGGTARQRLGLRKSSAAFPCMHRMGKRQGTGKSESQLDTCPCGQAVQNLSAFRSGSWSARRLCREEPRLLNQKRKRVNPGTDA